jgi:hypothetical protein
MLVSKECWERGCSCYDDRVDKDPVEVFERKEKQMNDFDCTDDLMKYPKHKADDLQYGGTHYKSLEIQPWHLMEAVLTREEFIGYLKGNLIKYAMRQGRKDSPDVEKYQHYKHKLDEVMGEQ